MEAILSSFASRGAARQPHVYSRSVGRGGELVDESTNPVGTFSSADVRRDCVLKLIDAYEGEIERLNGSVAALRARNAELLVSAQHYDAGYSSRTAATSACTVRQRLCNSMCPCEQIEADLRQLLQENESLRQMNADLTRENELLKLELKCAGDAADICPYRPSESSAVILEQQQCKAAARGELFTGSDSCRELQPRLATVTSSCRALQISASASLELPSAPVRLATSGDGSAAPVLQQLEHSLGRKSIGVPVGRYQSMQAHQLSPLFELRRADDCAPVAGRRSYCKEAATDRQSVDLRHSAVIASQALAQPECAIEGDSLFSLDLPSPVQPSAPALRQSLSCGTVSTRCPDFLDDSHGVSIDSLRAPAAQADRTSSFNLSSAGSLSSSSPSPKRIGWNITDHAAAVSAALDQWNASATEDMIDCMLLLNAAERKIRAGQLQQQQRRGSGTATT